VIDLLPLLEKKMNDLSLDENMKDVLREGLNSEKFTDSANKIGELLR